MTSMFDEESLKQPFLGHDEDRPKYLDLCRENTSTKRGKDHTRWLISFLMISNVPMIMAIIFLLLRLSKYTLEQMCAHPELVPCKY